MFEKVRQTRSDVSYLVGASDSVDEPEETLAEEGRSAKNGRELGGS